MSPYLETVPHSRNRPAFSLRWWMTASTLVVAAALLLAGEFLPGTAVGEALVSKVGLVFDGLYAGASRTGFVEQAEVMLALSMLVWPLILVSHIVLNVPVRIRTTLPAFVLFLTIFALTAASGVILYGATIPDPDSLNRFQRSVGGLMTSSRVGFVACLSLFGCCFVYGCACLRIIIKNRSSIGRYTLNIPDENDSPES